MAHFPFGPVAVFYGKAAFTIIVELSNMSVKYFCHFGQPRGLIKLYCGSNYGRDEFSFCGCVCTVFQTIQMSGVYEEILHSIKAVHTPSFWLLLFPYCHNV